MSGNTIGRSFCVTTFGESHGPALGAIVDGCPPGLELSEGGHPGGSRTRGAPGLRGTRASARNPTGCASSRACSKDARRARRSASMVDNVDARSRDYEKIKDRFRPGPCRLCLPAEVRIPRLPRRRARLGTNHGCDRGRRRDRAQVPARKIRHRGGGLAVAGRVRTGSIAWIWRRPAAIRSSAPIRTSCRCSRTTSGNCGATATRPARACRSRPAACRRDSASRCSTGSMRTSRSR